MNRQIAFYCGLLIVISCTRNSTTLESINKNNSRETVAIPEITQETSEKHKWVYNDSIVIADSKIKFDTIKHFISTQDTVIFYRINPVTKQELRICSNYILLGKDKIGWKKSYGFPNEFIGSYLFSNVYRGGGNGGTITKMKFRISNGEPQLVDSIIGGEYSEGAGTWEWLISDTGNPQTILFHGGDSWSVRNDTLLITPNGSNKTHLIDLTSKDTILSLLRPDRRIWDQLILEKSILFSTEIKSGLRFLKLYDFNGKLLWTINPGSIGELLAVAKKRLLIAGVCCSSIGDNTSYTVAFDLDSGQMKWSFPTLKAIHQTMNLGTSKILSHSTTSLFEIGDGIYGMIVEILTKEHEIIKYDNKLIAFNAKGQIYGTINLSKSKQDYSVINTGENQFQIVSNYESWSFKIYAP